MTPRVLVAMGVSGSGKSTFGAALADRLGSAFQEGDDLHPPANVAKMRRGEPLDDSDRAPWLDRVGSWMAAEDAAGRFGVVSCSALKRAYRDRLRTASPRAGFLLLHVEPQVLRDRLAGRRGHYMPASLLDSQLATLEPLAPDERALTLDGTRGVEDNVADALAWLARLD